MTMQVGLKNGQPVAYDPSDPLSSYGVQPATVTPSGNVVATGYATYNAVPHPGGGVTTYVSPSGEATQLAQGGPVQGTVQMPAQTSQPTQTSTVQPTAQTSGVLTAGPAQSNFSVVYSTYIGEGQWKNVVRTDKGMQEIITGKGPLSASSPVIQPITTGLEVKPDLTGKDIIYQGAAGFMSGVVGTLFLPITGPVTAINLAREISVAGPSYIPFKIEQFAKGIVTTATTQPVFFASSIVGSIAGGKMLGDFAGEIKDVIKNTRTETIGMTESQITGMQGEAQLGTTTGKFATKAGSKNILTTSESQFKAIGKGDVSLTLEKGISESLIERKGLEKLAGGSRVYTEIETPFLGTGISKEIIPDIFAEGFKIKTPKEMTQGAGLSRRIIESPEMDVFQTAAKTPTGASFLKQTISKIPPNQFEPTAFGQSLEFKSFKIATSLASEFHKNVITKALEAETSIPFIAPPVMPQMSLEKQMSKEQSFSMPKSAVINIEKQRQTSANIPIFIPSEKSLQQQFEGLKNIQNPIQIPYTMPSFKTAQTPFQTPFQTPIETPIQMPKQTPITIPTTISITTPFFKPPKIIPPTFPTLSFGSLPEGFVHRRRGKYRRTRQPRGYLPSMGAVLMGIRGSMPKGFGGMLSGIEMRPLVDFGGRKHRKKRKR